MRGLPEYCIYTHYSIYIDLVARPWLFSRLLFCRIPAVSRNVRVGLLTEVGLAPQARPREQPGRLRRVAQVSLRRLAPDLQACLLFSPTGLKRTAENLGDVFLALYMLLVSVTFPRFTNLICWGISGPTRSSFPGLLRLFALRAHERVAALAGAPGVIFKKMK